MATEVINNYVYSDHVKLIKLTAHISSPILTKTPIHLDSIMSRIRPGKTQIERANSLMPLPLCAIIDGAMGKEVSWPWVWAATAAFYPKEAHITLDNNQILNIDTPHVFFYAALDSNPKELVRIIKRIDSIGANGTGKVDYWKIENSLKHWSICCAYRGIATRNIPDDFTLSRSDKLYPIIYPYYTSKSLRYGYRTGDKVELINTLALRGKTKFGDFKIVDSFEYKNEDSSK